MMPNNRNQLKILFLLFWKDLPKIEDAQTI